MKAKTLCAIALAVGIIGCGPDTRTREALYNAAVDQNNYIKPAKSNLIKANFLRIIEIAERNNQILSRYNRAADYAVRIEAAKNIYEATSGLSFFAESRYIRLLDAQYQVLGLIEEQQRALIE